jgi:hypothetical protein
MENIARSPECHQPGRHDGGGPFRADGRKGRATILDGRIRGGGRQALARACQLVDKT